MDGEGSLKETDMKNLESQGNINAEDAKEDGASEYGHAMRGNIESKFKHPVVRVEQRPSSNHLRKSGEGPKL